MDFISAGADALVNRRAASATRNRGFMRPSCRGAPGEKRGDLGFHFGRSAGDALRIALEAEMIFESRVDGSSDQPFGRGDRHRRALSETTRDFVGFAGQGRIVEYAPD